MLTAILSTLAHCSGVSLACCSDLRALAGSPVNATYAAVPLPGVVSVIFVVDASGKVVNPRIEKSSNAAFEKPALDAVKQWKFEPAVKGGQRVACTMRQPIRFQPS